MRSGRRSPPTPPLRSHPEPKMAGFPLRGEIFFVHLPGETKERPALVVSVNARNEFGNSVLVVPLTTNPRPAPTHVPLKAGEGGLPRDSQARCENITTVPKSVLTRGPLGPPLPVSRMQEIADAVMRALGIMRLQRLSPPPNAPTRLSRHWICSSKMALSGADRHIPGALLWRGRSIRPAQGPVPIKRNADKESGRQRPRCVPRRAFLSETNDAACCLRKAGAPPVR